MTFADKLEKASLNTIESGTMTKANLALIATLENVNAVNSEEFIKTNCGTLEIVFSLWDK